MREIKVSLPDEMIEALKILVNQRAYPSRNEAIRAGVRELCRKEKVKIGE